MEARPRIDLDGVALADPKNPIMPLAIFRHRTTEGLTLLIPESAELVVPWKEIEEASLDLASGEVRVAFKAGYAKKQNWLRGARVLAGRWMDGLTMTAA